MSHQSAIKLTQSVKSYAQKLGFDLCGVAQVVSPQGVSRLQGWLDKGFAGEMTYLSDRIEAYRDPNLVLNNAKCIVMLTMNYATAQPVVDQPGHGRIARYAWGQADYHDLIKSRLRDLESHFVSESQKELGENSQVRTIVDTAPLLEREFAMLAGLGWFGKNTMLINKHRGSYFFLAAMLTNVELVPDQPFEASHCGTCTACLDACPTDAFPEPGVLDASRCISYLTIEHRSEVPQSLREGIGNWLFGCDICQEVCPWNRKTRTSTEEVFQPQQNHNPVNLPQLFDLPDDAFRKRFRKTPLWRAKRRGLLRNAAIALGYSPGPGWDTALAIGVNDSEPLVRGAAAWALGNIAQHPATELLIARWKIETDDGVIHELNVALKKLESQAEDSHFDSN